MEYIEAKRVSRIIKRVDKAINNSESPADYKDDIFELAQSKHVAAEDYVLKNIPVVMAVSGSIASKIAMIYLRSHKEDPKKSCIFTDSLQAVMQLNPGADIEKYEREIINFMEFCRRHDFDFNQQNGVLMNAIWFGIKYHRNVILHMIKSDKIVKNERINAVADIALREHEWEIAAAMFKLGASIDDCTNLDIYVVDDPGELNSKVYLKYKYCMKHVDAAIDRKAEEYKKILPAKVFIVDPKTFEMTPKNKEVDFMAKTHM